MGHDTTAYRPDVDLETARTEFRLDDFDDAWAERYEKYREAVEIAYNRRAAGNPLNQVLYLALGVMDDAYAGCSGNGETLTITLDQFRTGLATLRNKSFDGMTRERNLSDAIVDAFAAMGATVTRGEPNCDIATEIQFIENCIAYCESHGLTSLDVTFG